MNLARFQNRSRGFLLDCEPLEDRRVLNVDFNGDGLYNCGDMDLLNSAQQGPYNAAFDVNQDGLLNAADTFAWLEVAGNIRFGPGRVFLPGDANLDGLVDGSDKNLVSQNHYTNNTQWCMGNFNQDGVTDVADWNIWNAHKFTQSRPWGKPDVPLAPFLADGHPPKPKGLLDGGEGAMGQVVQFAAPPAIVETAFAQKDFQFNLDTASTKAASPPFVARRMVFSQL